jgi:S1-C subfamily serine protease
MTSEPDLLTQVSSALEQRVRAAKQIVAALRLSNAHAISALFWRPNVLVTSEQSLANQPQIEVIKGVDRASAVVLGRDPQTNIAVLKIERQFGGPMPMAAEAQLGGLALAIAGTHDGNTSVRIGAVRRVGPQWFSQAGGRIDALISLDIILVHHEEGGPVLNAAGQWLGMSTFGPRGQVLVIPAATISRIVPQLLGGGVRRGWLGVKLQPVAVPDSIPDAAGQKRGMMIMSMAENAPAREAGLVPGDIIIGIDGTAARRIREIGTRFGAESIGQTVELQVVRSGAVRSIQATIGERPKDE